MKNLFDDGKVHLHNAWLLTGRLPKRSTGPDCNSGGLAFEGSNPSLPTSCPLSGCDRTN